MAAEPVHTGTGETLDPADWVTARALAHRAVDDAYDYVQGLREGPVWVRPPDEVRAELRGGVPRRGSGEAAAYEDFLRLVKPYPMGNAHPRFWGWYMGAGNVMGSLGDFWCAVLNTNMGGADHSPALVESQVVDWCKELVGFPADAGGLLVTGASEANLIGLAVCRHERAGVDVRRDGVAGSGDLVVYASSEVHSCHQKSVELLGLGERALRIVPVGEDYTMDLDALRGAIAEDRAAGRRPICVIGTAGTINTGAVDDLTAIADLCAAEGLWFHVDGAIGGFVGMTSRGGQVAGLERADSVALDLHKWMHAPIDVGLALVRDRAAHRSTFTLTPTYLTHATRGLAAGDLWFSDYGIALSRGFRGLKVWLALTAYGSDALARLMDQNMDQAEHLAARVRSTPRLELMAPVGMDIVCFRYDPGGLTGEELDRLNEEVVIRIHESGVAVTSSTTLRGRYCIRVGLANHRTRIADLDLLVDTVLATGATVAAEMAPGG